jgi:hypothetical protein
VPNRTDKADVTGAWIHSGPRVLQVLSESGFDVATHANPVRHRLSAARPSLASSRRLPFSPCQTNLIRSNLKRTGTFLMRRLTIKSGAGT